MFCPILAAEIDCACDGINMMCYYENVDQMIRFFIGLLYSFSYARSLIILLRPIFDINEVFALVLQ